MLYVIDNDMFIILIMLMILKIYTYVKTNKIVYIKYVNYTSIKL